MFIVALTYTAPLARIDAFLEAHRAFLEEFLPTMTAEALAPWRAE